jgi:N-acetylneuraminic acid mutarotase
MHNEYEDIDHALKQFPATGGFTVPHGYFQRMKQHVLDQTTRTGNDTVSIADVPEEYFDQLRAKILAQTTQKTQEKPALQVWYKRNITRYAAAAAVIIFSSAIVLINRQSTPSMATLDASEEEIIQYLEHNTDLRDVQVIDVSFASEVSVPTIHEEQEIINQTDEQSILEEL